MDTQKNMQNGKIYENQVSANLTLDEQTAKLAAKLLNDNSQHLNAVTLQHLSEARDLAVNRSMLNQGLNQSGNVMQWIGHGFDNYFEHHRWMSAGIIIAAILFAFFTAKKFNADVNLENSDALLLASELPPEAFADKGFDTWLVSRRD